MVGFVARDPAGARGLWAGELTRRFAGSELVRTVRSTAESVLAGWHQLIPDTAAASDEPTAEDEHTDAGARAVPGEVPVMEGARS